MLPKQAPMRLSMEQFGPRDTLYKYANVYLTRLGEQYVGIMHDTKLHADLSAARHRNKRIYMLRIRQH